MSLIKKPKNNGIQIIEIGILLMIANFMTAIFIWQSILNGWKIEDGGRFFFHALVQKEGGTLRLGIDQAGAYVGFLSILFSYLGNREELVLVCNLLFQLCGVFLFYGGTKIILNSSFACVFSAVAAICSVKFFPVTFDFPIHITWFFIALAFFLFSKVIVKIRDEAVVTKRIILFILGVISGFFIFYDFTGIFLLTCISMFRLNHDVGTVEEKAKDLVSVISIAIITFLVLVFYYFSASQPLLLGLYQWYEKRMAYYYENTLMWKGFLGISLLFFIYLSMNMGFLVVRCRQNRVSTMGERLEKKVSDSLQEKYEEIKGAECIPLERNSELKKMSITEEAKDTKQEPVIAESKEDKQEPVIVEDKGVNQETKCDKNISEEKKGKVKLLDNPLPLPKKHVKKEMNYAFEPSKEQMHYDLNNYDVNDDYDLK